MWISREARRTPRQPGSGSGPTIPMAKSAPSGTAPPAASARRTEMGSRDRHAAGDRAPFRFVRYSGSMQHSDLKYQGVCSLRYAPSSSDPAVCSSIEAVPSLTESQERILDRLTDESMVNSPLM